MNTQFIIQPLDIRHGLDGLGKLMTTAFTDNATTNGCDFFAEVRSLKRLVLIIIFFRYVSKAFRHRLDGFVIKERDNKVSMVIIKQTKSGTWKIDNNATHLK